MDPWFGRSLPPTPEYVFTDEADAKEVDDCTPRPTAKQKHQLSSVIVLPKNSATVEPEEKLDVEETKNDDMDLRENVTIFSSNNAKQNFRCTTRIEALNIQNAILGISKVVLGLHRDTKDNASTVPQKHFVAYVSAINFMCQDGTLIRWPSISHRLLLQAMTRRPYLAKIPWSVGLAFKRAENTLDASSGVKRQRADSEKLVACA